MTTPTEVWLHCPVPRPDARYRLVCFPHAGGSASFFRDWGTWLPDCEVYAVRYPARAERIGEPTPVDIRVLGAEIASATASLCDRPLALFGHSMGAVVALEAARALEADGVRVAHVFASGSRDGECPPPDPDASLDDDDDTLAAQLVAMGGTDPDLAADPLFRELVLPYVRGDGRMFHSYDFRIDPVLSAPVTTIAGDADPDADRRPWATLTNAGFRQRVVSGNHFYLVSEPPYALIEAAMAGPTGPSSATYADAMMKQGG